MSYGYAREGLTMSVNEAAKLVNISPDTIRAAVRRGEDVGFPVFKAGRAYKVPRRPLLRLMGLEEKR